MIGPQFVATSGYLSTPLSIATDGWLGEPVAGGSRPARFRLPGVRRPDKLFWPAERQAPCMNHFPHKKSE